VLAAAWATALAAAGTAAEPIDLERAAATARRAGLSIHEGHHLLLLSDRPAADTAVAELPKIFDEAFVSWCDHFGIAADSLADWRALGCLMTRRDTFRACGLLPDTIPDFENGFCDRRRFWIRQPSSPAYRRHLLLHEGVHAFTLTVRNLATPPWYTEGIAELLATHRLTDGRFEATPIPVDPGDVEQLGRIEAIRSLRRRQSAPSLAEVFATPADRHHRIPAYAASWAAVAMLSRHPRYREAFARAERGLLDSQFTSRLEATDGFDTAAATRDFDAFTAELDYGYDPQAMAIDFSVGPPLAGPRNLAVPAARGWHNAGVSARAGDRCRFRASGRVGLGQLPATAESPARPIESEADGISLEWYRGRPLGRLLVGQWRAAPQRGRPQFERIAEGVDGIFTAAVDGPIFLKINQPPGRLAVAEGSYRVRLEPAD
jgi:hypothetical protein